MSKSVNKVTILGRLGRDPEMKYTSGGIPFCRFSVATDESWTDKGSNEKKTQVEWHSCVAWRKLAEICNQYLAKGRQVYIEGKLQTTEFDGKDGVTRKSTQIVVSDVTFLGGAEDGGRSSSQGGAMHGSGSAGVPDSWGTPGEAAAPPRGGPGGRSEYDDSGDPW